MDNNTNLVLNRFAFLRDFLGALGAKQMDISEVSEDTVRGTVIYEPNNSEETQDFCWHAREQDLPDDRVFRLINLIHQHRLLDIDRLKVSRGELRVLYNKVFEENLGSVAFGNILDQLEEIEVRMVDDGVETDHYFIHE
jgi:hypothetical protein